MVLDSQSPKCVSHQWQRNAEREYFGNGHAEPDAEIANERCENKQGNKYEDNAAAEGNNCRLDGALNSGVETAANDVDERDQVV